MNYILSIILTMVTLFIVENCSKDVCGQSNMGNSCNWCLCGSNGQIIGCTMFTCTKKKKKGKLKGHAIKRKQQPCATPGKLLFVDNCNSCVCSEDGYLVDCTTMQCPDNRVKFHKLRKL